jgi:hypothetical protein
MKKRILILGKEMFIDYIYKNNTFASMNNPLIKKMLKKYQIDNFSSYNLDSTKALNYAKVMISKYNYEKVIIDLDDHKLLVDYLKDNNIEPIIINEEGIEVVSKTAVRRQVLSYL